MRLLVEAFITTCGLFTRTRLLTLEASHKWWSVLWAAVMAWLQASLSQEGVSLGRFVTLVVDWLSAIFLSRCQWPRNTKNGRNVRSIVWWYTSSGQSGVRQWLDCDLRVMKIICRTPSDPAWMLSSSPRPKACCKCASLPRISFAIDRATFHMCRRDSCRWPYISLTDRVMLLQSCTNNRINGSCGYSIAASLRERELGRPTWKQNQLCMKLASSSSIELKRVIYVS